MERGTLGDEIGYHVRFDRKAGPHAVLAVTPGILLRMLHDNPFLESVGVVVFDEFHERGLESDLAASLGRLVQQTVRPDLRIVVMSATLAVEAVAEYLDRCPVVASEGRLHPVEIVWEPRSDDVWLSVAVAGRVRLLDRTDGDLLVFLPVYPRFDRRRGTGGTGPGSRAGGAAAARRLAAGAAGRRPAPLDRRKVILATNVAETSVTIEGITGVVDSGLARQMSSTPTSAWIGAPRAHLEGIGGPAGRTGGADATGRVRATLERGVAPRPARTD
jgi:ATP-dependent helicase HrpB